MKIIFFFILISTTCFAQKADDETFSWSEDRSLVWSDFRGQPDLQNDAVASTASGISFGFSINKAGRKITGFTANVECVFYPNTSWHKPEDATAYILKHEQFHFNITELHARKFRKKIKSLKPSSKVQGQLNNLYQAISKASFDMQKQYDAETNHSINKIKQAEWETFIISELKKLEAFKTK